MTTPKFLDRAADVSQIVTGLMALLGLGTYILREWRNKKVLERHLWQQKDIHGGKRSILHIVAETGLTEGEILKAAIASSFVKLYKRQNKETGLTEQILFGYDPAGKSKGQ